MLLPQLLILQQTGSWSIAPPYAVTQDLPVRKPGFSRTSLLDRATGFSPSEGTLATLEGLARTGLSGGPIRAGSPDRTNQLGPGRMRRSTNNRGALRPAFHEAAEERVIVSLRYIYPRKRGHYSLDILCLRMVKKAQHWEGEMCTRRRAGYSASNQPLSTKERLNLQCLERS